MRSWLSSISSRIKMDWLTKQQDDLTCLSFELTGEGMIAGDYWDVIVKLLLFVLLHWSFSFSSSSGRSVLKMRRGNGYEMKKKKSTRELLYLIIWLYFCCLFKHFFLSSFRNLLGVLVQPTWTVFIVQCCGKQLIFSLSFAIIEFPLSHVGHER